MPILHATLTRAPDHTGRRAMAQGAFLRHTSSDGLPSIRSHAARGLPLRKPRLGAQVPA